MHYSLLVIGEDCHELLAPYQENNMGDVPAEYLQFEIEYTEEEFDNLPEDEQDEVIDDYVEHKGNYGYWYNPNGEWDWYQVGGRFFGALYVKEGVEVYNDVSFLAPAYTDKQMIDEGRSSRAKVSDIDWNKTKLVPYAYIKDGKFIENQYKDHKEFYDNIISDLDDDEVLTMVDCHT